MARSVTGLFMDQKHVSRTPRPGSRGRRPPCRRRESKRVIVKEESNGPDDTPE